MVLVANAQPAMAAARYASLKRYADLSLDWIGRNLDEFAPMRDGHLHDLRSKAFAELALVYTYLQQGDDLRLDEPLRVWYAFLLRHSEDMAYAQLARKRPTVAYAYLIPYLMLRSTGYSSPYYEETLAKLRRWGLLRVAEVVPYRALDQEYMLWKSGLARREPPWHLLYRRTALGRCRSPLWLDDEGAYSITHTLFYLTDFGNRPAPFSSEEVEHAASIVECLLLHYWRVGHWDLVGELLISLNCLRAQASPIYEAATEAFQGAWQSDGAIPAKREKLQQGDMEQKSEGEDKAFRLCYHSTLVGILYCATTMKRIGSSDGGNPG